MSLPIAAFFLMHWWVSVFFQSFFLHRYAAHRMFQLSKFWQRCFHLLTYLAQGASYLTPAAYAVLHRMHHHYSDQAGDPHSPRIEPNPLKMMVNTLKDYRAVLAGSHPLARPFAFDLVQWPALDRWGRSWASAGLWVSVYAGYYAVFVTATWQWLLLPFHLLMGPIHGGIVNYFGHKLGYRNHALGDNSRNTLWFDFITLGELFQNNHHARPGSPNFATRRFEFDPVWPIVFVMDRLKILRLRGKEVVAQVATETRTSIESALAADDPALLRS